jgi:outer membrane protease
MTGARVRCAGAVLVMLGMGLAFPPSVVRASDEEPAKPRLELALNSWLFTNGETKWSHNASGLDPRLGNPTSKLTYKDNNSHILELSGKFNIDRRWFVRVDGGFSVAFHRGTLTDDDFTSVGGQHLFSETTSNITGSGTQYVNADVGYRLLDYQGNRGNLDVFVGYQYWRTIYEASGITQVVCTPSGIPGIACNPAGTVSNQGQVVITNMTQWNSLRVGLQTEYRLTRRFSVQGKVAFIPVSYLQNDDIHHLRTDLQQNPSFYMSGFGIGTDVEAGARYMIYRGWFLNAGYRFWWNRVVGDGNWKVYPVGAPSASAPLTEFQTMRYGVTLGLSHVF